VRVEPGVMEARGVEGESERTLPPALSELLKCLDVRDVHAGRLLRLLPFVYRLGLGRQVAEVVVGVIIILRIFCVILTDNALEWVDIEDFVGRLSSLCS
jgi:hypothetical protein